MALCHRTGCAAPGVESTGADLGDHKLCVHHLRHYAIAEYLHSVENRPGAWNNFITLVDAVARATGRSYRTVRSELIDAAEAVFFAGRAG